jgi:hypothetical protein
MQGARQDVEPLHSVSLDSENLQEDKDKLLLAVDILHMEIEHASSEKETLVLKHAVLNDKLDYLKACL